MWNIDHVADVIEVMMIRGAPAIGVAAAFGMAMTFRNRWQEEGGISAATLNWAADRLKKTRSTAVNLFHAVDSFVDWLGKCLETGLQPELDKAAIQWAVDYWDQDIGKCVCIGDHGAAELSKMGNRIIMTHCNAGALATGGHGTALGVIRSYVKKDGL